MGVDFPVSTLRKHAFPKLGILAVTAASLLATAVAACNINRQPAPTTQPTTTIITSTTSTAAKPAIPGIENIMSKYQIRTTMDEILSADLSAKSPVTDRTREIWKKAEEVNKSIYYLITGRTFEQDNFTTKIFTLGEKLPEVPERYLNPDGTAKDFIGTVVVIPGGSIEILALGTPTGYNTDAYNSARTLVMLLANETGNAMDTRLLLRQDIKYTYGGLVDSPADTRYWEASKMAYQGAVFRFLEEEIGINLKVVDIPENRELIRRGVEVMRTSINPVMNGWYLMWTILLENQELKNELDQNRKLSSASCMKLHDIILKEHMTRPDYSERLKKALENQSTEQTITSYIYKNLAASGASITRVMMGETYHLFGP